MNILLVIFLFSVTFVSSTSIRRQDTLNGDFKPCQGNFPNEITAFGFTPNPLIGGQESTGHIAGKATVPIENGALYKITGYYENIQVTHNELSFCERFVTPSGFTCPVKDNFDFTAKSMEATSSIVPKNTLVEYDVKIMITNPDGKDLSCIEGKVRKFYP